MGQGRSLHLQAWGGTAERGHAETEYNVPTSHLAVLLTPSHKAANEQGNENKLNLKNTGQKTGGKYKKPEIIFPTSLYTNIQSRVY